MNGSRISPLKPGVISPCRYKISRNAMSRAALGLLLALGAATSLVAATPASAPAIRVISGARQQTTYASQFASPLVVWVTEASTHHPLRGVRVNFTSSAGLSLSAAYARTDEAGLARVTATGFTPGLYTVTAQVENYPAATASFEDLQVNKALLTIIPADLRSTPGVVPQISTYSIQGFVNGDTASTAQITGSPALTTTATTRSRYGNYALKGGPGSLTSPNYDFVAGFGTLAIVPGPVPKGMADADTADAREPSLTAAPLPVVTPIVKGTVVQHFTARLTMENASTPGTGKLAEGPTISAAPIPAASYSETAGTPMRTSIEQPLAATPSAPLSLNSLGAAAALHVKAGQEIPAPAGELRAVLLERLAATPAPNEATLAPVRTAALPTVTVEAVPAPAAAPIRKAIHAQGAN